MTFLSVGRANIVSGSGSRLPRKFTPPCQLLPNKTKAADGRSSTHRFPLEVIIRPLELAHAKPRSPQNVRSPWYFPS